MLTEQPTGHLVFVYGLLKRGLALSHLMEGQEFLGEAHTAPGFRLHALDGGAFPGLTGPAEGGVAVAGELWRVGADCLAALDAAEGVAEGVYERRRLPLAPPHENLVAEAYFYRGPLDGCPDVGDCWTG
jgi:gamma-glutamylcyclotransferase (GGCT)/AIG2-like uncharacterized protein YtfP